MYIDSQMLTLIKQFKYTFGKYDEVDITYPFWFKKKYSKWPW